MDSFRESMDSFRIVVTNPDSKKIRFVSCHESWLHRFANPDSRIRTLKIRIVDSFRDLNFQRFDLFSRIQRILTNPYESLRILSTIPRNESLQIQSGGFANPDLRIRTLKIRFVDSFRRLNYELPVRICRNFFQIPVSWIRFVRPKISKDSICFVS